MKRFLIFGALFPPLALVMFSAPDAILHRDFQLLDLVTLGMAYTFLIIPALILAVVDRKFRRIEVTTVAGLLTAFLAAFSIGFPFGDPLPTLMVALVGAMPAVVCSWVSDKSMRSQNA